ncbi:MAG: SusD/RagB family nutrient-binding outer membrane lipoprotein [Gemmatimonadaceae bacterium]|nr:SusD/RagB family nutrient-binding outer membrane lipoprotein [Gemmatimonadaceae bacterium]
MSRLKTLFVAGAAVAATACSDFLSGDKLDFDPNRPTSAQSAQLLTAVQVNSYYILNGHGARVLSMWMQQMAGTDRQYRGYDQYSITEGLFGEYSSAYTGGGLIDMRAIQADADASGNRLMGGIARVWEALVVSFLADMYGDIAYSQAVNGDEFPTPVLDPQADVYAALQGVLDDAIADLASGQGAVGNLDLSFGGNAARWIAAANTLKARLYLHTAETNPSAYSQALGALCTGAALNTCTKGIGSTAGNLNEYHSASSGEENIWWQFIARDRDSYMRPGKYLVDLMNSRSDPRRAEYFQLNGNGSYGGAAPGEGLNTAIHSNLGLTRLDPGYAQPILTYQEALSIIAESAYRTGNVSLARAALDALRGTWGGSAIGAGLSGTALLTAILQEKYIALFQNYEVYNDWKRTCYPNLVPATNAYQGNIPARFTYPVAERSSNPNVPAAGNQPRRNANDPVTATSADGTACNGQKS